MTKHDPRRRQRIADYIQANPDATIRELATEVGLASTAAVMHHLNVMRRSGAITDEQCPTCGHRILRAG